MRFALALLIAATATIPGSTQTRPRGRDLGIPFPGQTGPANAITDVAGIAVGHVTLIEGDGKLVPGKGPIRTGVTAILPRPRGNWDPVFAATFNLNGNGDMTGINWIKESGFLEGPILLTGTHSVGTVRDAAIQWQLKNGREFVFTYPIVAETFDFLNDANGEHVKPTHAFQALDRAKPGPVEEGAVGGGTGMGCNGFKGGIGTSSRVLTPAAGRLHGRRAGPMQLRRRLADPRRADPAGDHRPGHVHGAAATADPAVDARHPALSARPAVPRATTGRPRSRRPRLDHRHRRHQRAAAAASTRAHRAPRGHGTRPAGQLGRQFLRRSVPRVFHRKRRRREPDGTPALTMLPNDRIDPLFRATIDATEEAVVNAMLAAQTMTGADGIRVFGLPGDRVVAALRKYNRMK